MVTTIRKVTGGDHPFYEFACLSTDTKPTSLVPENSICHEIDTGKHFYCSNGEWKELPPKGGSGGGSGGGSDAKIVVTLTETSDDKDTFYTADKTFAEIDAAIKAKQTVVCALAMYDNSEIPLLYSEDDTAEFSGIVPTDETFKGDGTFMICRASVEKKDDYESWGYSEVEAGGSGGGGAEKFIVTLTQDEQTEEWTADKTVAEIVAADEAEKNVVVSFQYMGQLPTELPKVSWIHDPEGTSSFFMFSGIIYVESDTVAFIVGQQDGSSDVWQVTFTPIPTSTNAPLIVTLAVDQSTGNFVGDKTYKEVYDAVDGGQTVTFKFETSGFTFATNALSVGLANNEYSVALVIDGSITEAEGAENDYVSVHVN